MSSIRFFEVRDKYGFLVSDQCTVKDLVEITGYTYGTIKIKTAGLLMDEIMSLGDFTIKCVPKDVKPELIKNIPAEVWSEWDRVCMMLNSKIIRRD